VKKLEPAKRPEPQPEKGNGECPQPFLCPLSRVNAGVAVRIKQLSAPPEVTHRLRELGFCEEQKVKLLSRQSTVICQVCNARLGISTRLAEQILVEPLTRQKVA
jgi:Fe2+ transport system protein FeoA